MTAADPCAPSTKESGRGCEVEYRKGENTNFEKEIQWTDELVNFAFSKLLVLVFPSQ